MKAAIIGTGNLGLAIAKGLVANNAVEQLYLTKRNPKSLQNAFEQENVVVTADNLEAVKNSDILIFAVQPRHFSAVLKEIQSELKPNHVVISTITGFRIKAMEEIIGKDISIIRAMPNTAIAVGKSMTCVCSNQTGKTQVPMALDIFNQLGASIEIPEEQMQAATVICASGIAFWMRLIRATTQGAIQLGFESNEALQMSVQTCLGAASLLIESGNHPEQEIDRVTTPGGCTIEGLNEMEHQGLSSSLIKGLVTSYEKINQIS
ncbi:MAG: pyrroline-5-carboxylate reductase [Crocinitomicaceae bacterium]|nr:pyrroline-5-carboxylate reductase [Crocinitomicaceae bacterium]